jgi:hypothetical protein
MDTQQLMEKINNQIWLLTEEQFRVKMFLNSGALDCTSAPYVIAKRYRDELKSHINVLKETLKDFE